MIKTICVAGAGTMGSGIALVAAQAEFKVLLFDQNPASLEKAAIAIQKNIDFLIGKEKITPSAGSNIFSNIEFISDADFCIADFFIEAIVEDLEAKINLFNQFAALNDPAVIFATNTSSLPVSAIQTGIDHPERVAGMHFFNPAPAMKLVEVIRGKQTSEVTAKTIHMLCNAMGKVPVYCNDAPGFIVNRVARQYYLEAMRIVESGIASIEDVDALMQASGFKMGPFKLMDLIGIDINFTVSKMIYDALSQPSRLAPSVLQEEKIAKGELGRKTSKGFYDYHT